VIHPPHTALEQPALLLRGDPATGPLPFFYHERHGEMKVSLKYAKRFKKLGTSAERAENNLSLSTMINLFITRHKSLVAP